MDFAMQNTTTPCVGPITAFADYTLNNIFSCAACLAYAQVRF
jgi:hypothetical protein